MTDQITTRHQSVRITSRLCAILCCLVHVVGCNEDEEIARSARAYVKSAALEIVSSLELAGIDEMPQRNEQGILQIDSFVSENRHLPSGFQAVTNAQREGNDLRRRFGFPSTFVSSSRFVKSGFIKGESRKHAFEFVVLWKGRESDLLRKTSIIMTLDRDVIDIKDVHVNFGWPSSNLIEFPDQNSKTFLKILQFNDTKRK